MTRPTRIFNGKKYFGYGPYFYPNGVSTKDLKSEVESLKEQGGLVRVIKKEISPKSGRRSMFGNTHEVWIYTRAK
jgi:hypothetical protein